MIDLGIDYLVNGKKAYRPHSGVCEYLMDAVSELSNLEMNFLVLKDWCEENEAPEAKKNLDRGFCRLILSLCELVKILDADLDNTFLEGKHEAPWNLSTMTSVSMEVSNAIHSLAAVYRNCDNDWSHFSAYPSTWVEGELAFALYISARLAEFMGVDIHQVVADHRDFTEEF